jgi:asparagine synthase (glutamine-hydrolysing)
MCGIAGYWHRTGAVTADELDRLGRQAGQALAHRGPDGDDVWADAPAGLVLAHRRLAIVDLSPTGFQPMVSSCGRYVITYNGEVFNFRELRAELAAAGQCFRGTSDTEVILEGFARWGVVATIQRLIGMFALALWDRKDRALWLVRDRLGIKPLYYRATADLVLFGSELKALRAMPGWTPEIDPIARAQFLERGYVPHPRTIYKGVQKLPPGTALEIRQGSEPHLTRYWDLKKIASAGLATAQRHERTPEEDVDALERLLRDAVKRRMIADVPLGAFLSGGVDSSTVVALMQAESSQPVKTYSIGFREGTYNEAHHARSIAAHLGTDHTELIVDPQLALDVIPKLPQVYDEPFADSSQIPTYLVAQMTRRHVTVALSGDGGDELFAGYHRYGWGERVWERMGAFPGALRQTAAGLAGIVGSAASVAVSPTSVVARRLDQARRLLACNNPAGLYSWLTQPWPDATQLLAEPPPVDDSRPMMTLNGSATDIVSELQFRDLAEYLPEDILTKLDRATMAVSLEGRVPLLDHRVVEFAWALPSSVKRRGHEAKWVLREVLARHVPRTLTDRPKKGFEVPIGAWLQDELRDWAEVLLAPAALEASGFRPQPIRNIWQAHCTTRQDFATPLWVILMYQDWRRGAAL